MKTTQTWKIGDCLQLLPEIPDKSIDMILTDLPYGTSGNKWDIVLPFEPLWKQYERVIKDNGVIVLTSKQPFTSTLICSNLSLFKYTLVWNKEICGMGDVLSSKYRPLQVHEDITIFSFGGCSTGSACYMNYHPQKTPRRKKRININYNNNLNRKDPKSRCLKIRENTLSNLSERQPVSIVDISNSLRNGIIHPTQKPLALFEYLIKTYTNEGDTVHDSCLGSGTTLEACMNLNRNCIGFEIDPQWEPIYRKRLKLDNTKLDAFNTSAEPK